MSDSKNKTVLNKFIKNHVTDIVAYSGLLICIIIFSIVPPLFGENIWSATKLTTLMSNLIVMALMAVGAVFVYSLGNMDVSIGKQIGLYATLIVVIGNKTGSLIPGILLSLVISIVIACINGATGELLKIHPIISSLVFMMLLSGVSSITYTKLGSRNISLTSIDYSMFKNPWIMLTVLVIEILIISYLFYFTKYGKFARAMGANRIAANQCGINLVKYKMICYIIMGTCLVTASVFQMGYTGSASDSTGTGFEMNVMVSLILGGMPLSGGMRSKISYAVIGAFTFSILNVGLPLIGVKPNQVFLVKAIIFMVVVLFTCRKPKGALPR
jgi:ribose transport system permease protein